MADETTTDDVTISADAPSDGDSTNSDGANKMDNGDQVFKSLWKEHLYSESQKNAEDTRFFNNALKSSHIEGKMSAREMQFTRAFGPPVSANRTTQ